MNSSVILVHVIMAVLRSGNISPALTEILFLCKLIATEPWVIEGIHCVLGDELFINLTGCE